jgi:hypothetical protein
MQKPITQETLATRRTRSFGRTRTPLKLLRPADLTLRRDEATEARSHPHTIEKMIMLRWRVEIEKPAKGN